MSIALAPIIDIVRVRTVADLADAVVRSYRLSGVGGDRVGDAIEDALLGVLRAAESLAARTAELEAVQALADAHVRRRGVCPSCRWYSRCETLQSLRRRIRRLEAACRREEAKLARGGTR